MPGARRGFTLVELLVALGLGLVVGALVVRSLLHGQRLARAQAERLALQDNVRSAALVLATELRSAGFDEISPAAAIALGYPAGPRSDLLAVQPGAVTYLAARGGGFMCRTGPPGAAEVVVRRSSWRSLREARASDTLVLFVESDPATGTDDGWVHLGVISVGAASCPDGAAGISLQVAGPAPLDLAAALTRVLPGAPARLYEVMQIRHYESGGQWWLGMRSVSAGEVVTPFAGPFADSSASTRGLTLVYRDAAGNPTSTPDAVRTVEIALVGVTDRPIYWRNVGRALVDSFALTTRVALRNARRP